MTLNINNLHIHDQSKYASCHMWSQKLQLGMFFIKRLTLFQTHVVKRALCSFGEESQTQIFNI